MKRLPTPAEMASYRVNRAGQEEGIRQSLYDFTDYAAAGQQTLTFFQTPEGQSGKTKADTNMTSAGQLPDPQKFLVESIEVLFFPGTNPAVYGAGAAANHINDAYVVSKSGWLQLFIMSKPYLEEAPIGRFPAKTRLHVEAAVSDASTAAANQQSRIAYASFAGRPYQMNPPIVLTKNQNFKVTLNWPAAVALPSGVNGRIGIVLDGVLFRASQ